MEVLLREGKAGIQNLDRLQEPLVLYNKPKAKLQVSEIGTIPLTIQLYVKAYSRKEHGEDR